MEVIKTTENLEFDAIYADGTQRHVAEGVLWEATPEGDIIFHQGTDRLSVIAAAAIDVLRYLKHVGPGLMVLAVGMCLTDDSRSALQELVTHALKLMDPERSVEQAIFRLGQMDMQQSIADMLTDLADGTQGVVRSTLIDAAQRVRGLCLCEKSEDV